MIIAFYIFTFLAYFIGAASFFTLSMNYIDEAIGYGLHPAVGMPIATLFACFAIYLLWSFHQHMSGEDTEEDLAAEAMGIQWPVLPEPGYDVAACQRQPSSMPFA